MQMALKAIRPPKERAQVEKGRTGGGGGQNPAATQDKASPREEPVKATQIKWLMKQRT